MTEECCECSGTGTVEDDEDPSMLEDCDWCDGTGEVENDD